jgi:hypothetical protein
VNCANKRTIPKDPAVSDVDSPADEWVLDYGLPPTPPTIDRGDSIPVARWIGPKYSAVLRLQWPADEDDLVETDAQMYVRNGTSWDAWPCGGGSGWWRPPFSRPPALRPRTVWVTGECGCQGRDGGGAWSFFGIAGADAAVVEVVEDGGTTARWPVESPFGGFVGAFNGNAAATARMYGADNRVLWEDRFLPGWL